MKVSNTVVCLDCDELFLEIRESCPFCGSLSHVFLRRYFPSLHQNGAMKKYHARPLLKDNAGTSSAVLHKPVLDNGIPQANHTYARFFALSRR